MITFIALLLSCDLSNNTLIIPEALVDIMPFWSTERLKEMNRYGRIRKRKGFQFDGEYPCELSHKGPIFQPFILFILPVGKRKWCELNFPALQIPGGRRGNMGAADNPKADNWQLHGSWCSVMGGWWSILKLNYSTVFLSSNWVPQLWLYVNVYLHGLLSITFRK